MTNTHCASCSRYELSGSPGETALRTASSSLSQYAAPYRLRRSLLRSWSFLLASDEYREGDGRDRDNGDEEVDEGGRASAHPYGFEEGLHVGDENDGADRCAQDAGRHEPHDVSRERGRNHTAHEERSHYTPGDLGEAEGEEEADARGDGHQELTGIHGAHHLAGFHPPGGY